MPKTLPFLKGRSHPTTLISRAQHHVMMQIPSLRATLNAFDPSINSPRFVFPMLSNPIFPLGLAMLPQTSVFFCKVTCQGTYAGKQIVVRRSLQNAFQTLTGLSLSWGRIWCTS